MTRHTPQRRRPSLLVRLLTNIILTLVVIYGLGTALLIGLWLASGESNVAVNLFVNTLPIGLCPAPLLLILVLLVRKWKFTIMLVAALAMLIGLYGTYFRPAGSVPLPRGTQVTLMTYNILFSNSDMASVERIIREQNTEIVALQEVTQEQRDYIDANLLDLYPFVARPNRLLGGHGQLILSKYPVTNTFDGQILRAEIDVQGSPLIVYSIQLTSPLNDPSNFDDDTREDDAELIRTTAATETKPFIIVGDFNMSDATQEYKNFTTELTDVFRYTSSGFGSTFPNWRRINPALGFVPSLIRLDYAFASRTVQPVSGYVVHDGFSDHLPLVVTIRVS